MKAILKTLSLMAALSAPQAFATTDAFDRVFLVVNDFNGEQDNNYFVERAPIVGCYGLAQGARLSAWTAEYRAPQNIGCGGKPVYEDINSLSCAKLVDAKESKDYASFSEITLDISKCEDKANPAFIKAIETSARKNFPQTDKKKSVLLKLIK